MSTEPCRTVVLGSGACELRRRLGPTSWVVLEEILQRTDGDVLVARVSVRTLASSLGLAKDTVARAVRRLRDAGLLVADQQRTGTGIFDTGTYRVTVNAACLTIATINTARRPTKAPNSPLPRHQSEQLELTLDT